MKCPFFEINDSILRKRSFKIEIEWPRKMNNSNELLKF